MSPVSLPFFSADNDREQAVLDASRAVLALYLRDGHTDHPVRALAAHTGLSERTFYRYFPRKEDALRPYLGAGLAQVVAGLTAASADRPLHAALLPAHAGLLDLAVHFDLPAILAVLRGTERHRAVWLQLLDDAEQAFTALVATRLGLAPGALQARLAGALIVAAGRTALLGDHPGPPSAVFAEALALVGAPLLTPPGSAR